MINTSSLVEILTEIKTRSNLGKNSQNDIDGNIDNGHKTKTRKASTHKRKLVAVATLYMTVIIIAAIVKLRQNMQRFQRSSINFPICSNPSIPAQIAFSQDSSNNMSSNSSRISLVTEPLGIIPTASSAKNRKCKLN